VTTYVNEDAHGPVDWELEEPPEDVDYLAPEDAGPASLAAVASLASLPGTDALKSDAPVRREANAILNDVRTWLSTYVSTMTPGDLDLLTLWAVHTHLASECYTSPRLQLDSPMPGSGKTTVLDHLQRLCYAPVQMAAVSSSALLARLLANEPRTLLIDEVDRTLDPKREGSQDIIAILNSGYRTGATRPVLEPASKAEGGGWKVTEMPVYAPVAMAGNNPNLPDDTRSRVLRVVLMPDLEGRVSESDWELIEPDAHALRDRIASWSVGASSFVRAARPALPAGVIGRNREKFGPLARIASIAGGRWPAVVDELALDALREQEQDREDGLIREAPAVLLLRHLHELWPRGEPFYATQRMCDDLAAHYPDQWGFQSPFGKPINAHRLGRMLSQAYRVHSRQPSRGAARGYSLADLTPAMRRMRIRSDAPPAGTDASDANDASDARQLKLA
jgi:hypothetical protein